MIQPLFLTYFAEEPSHRWGLSIHLDAGQAAGTPAAWLRDLHAAADVWRSQHPEVFLRSDLGAEARPSLPHKLLSSYLHGDGGINGSRLVRHLSMLRDTGRIHQFTIRPGGLVEGPDLVGRDNMLSGLLAILDTGSCHLRAPRRYGKTSLLRHLAEVLVDRGRPCVFVDVANSREVSSFLLQLARATVDTPLCRPELAGLPELARWPPPEAGPLERSEASRVLLESIERNPWSFGNRLLEALGRLGAVLLIDEFSVFLRASRERNPEDARQLAELLAHARRSSPQARQVFAGSAGLTSYLHFHGLGLAFADLAPLDLLPLDSADARVLAEELLYGQNLAPSPAAVGRMLEALGEPIPYFVHALADAVAHESGGGAISPDLVDRAYTRRLLGDWGSRLFGIYRLGDQPYPSSLLRPAALILNTIARTPQGAAESDLRGLFAKRARKEDSDRFEPLLACLQEDFDLVSEDGRWRMRNKVLRERWALRERWLTEAD